LSLTLDRYGIGVAGNYNRAVYGPEKKAALERWAAHVEALITGKPAKDVADIDIERQKRMAEAL
jgi:hypothetical protein